MATIPIGDVSRDGSEDPDGLRRTCPVCGAIARSPRAHYCSRACQQQAYRLRRQQPPQDIVAAMEADLRRHRRLVEQTVYECGECGERLLGERRCADCNRMCAKLGLGGHCGDCDAILLVTELLEMSR